MDAVTQIIMSKKMARRCASSVDYGNLHAENMPFYTKESASVINYI